MHEVSLLCICDMFTVSNGNFDVNLHVLNEDKTFISEVLPEYKKYQHIKSRNNYYKIK